MKITSKGQVTIPKAMRESFGLLPGTEVEFVPGEDDELHVRKARAGRRRGEDVVAHLREAGKHYTMTTEEVMRLTRGEDWGTGRLEEGDGDPA
ncbi:MAG TPA: AbrB/MazE/SpoVT family DNA-binding domain-containing protein [Solirubrobacterales bacterium]|jgi:AbrB family looped-hinge helix DNA binding protein|nr:AbrB/MazE/SpoVT family DNA-binding domain-containing protein [Solirubrobacterales bacterium]